MKKQPQPESNGRRYKQPESQKQKVMEVDKQPETESNGRIFKQPEKI